VHAQADLLQVIDALRPPGRFARGLHGGEQQRDQDRDDGDDHQELDQGEAATCLRCHTSLRRKIRHEE